MARIKKASLVDQIYTKLREDIISQRIPMGTRLNVNELQSDLGVSCTPIREAVNRLQQEELVRYENNVGARVLTLDEHDVGEIQELARTPRESVRAVHNLIGVFYHHCGNQRLDRSMIAIQGQVLLLRYIYADCLGCGDHYDDLSRMLDGVERGDVSEICDALQEYSDQATPAIIGWLREHN